ncbi:MULTISPECIES: hypothetical protein [unclassified Spiroplasma]|uniref:hypothetical protein n=1 Tax=unclassified Spiroplasma TaxID=2637901 RepID=UPI0030CD9C91
MKTLLSILGTMGLTASGVITIVTKIQQNSQNEVIENEHKWVNVNAFMIKKIMDNTKLACNY